MDKQVINKEQRKEEIKNMLKMLHEGKSLDQVRDYFGQVFDKVTAKEISEAEQALISEGLPVEEIQKLCDVHAAVFKGSIEEIHAMPESEKPGHPVWVMRQENKKLTQLVEAELLPQLKNWEGNLPDSRQILLGTLDKLAAVKVHYQRKENILFPYLEKHGITGPPKVMWSVDDEIRQHISDAINAVKISDKHSKQADAAVKQAANGLTEMVFKEENILLPMLQDAITEEEWVKIAEELPSIGYSFIKEPPKWSPAPSRSNAAAQTASVPEPSAVADGVVRLPTGLLKLNELISILNTLPIDISYVDKDDLVKFFSENQERIFPRTKAVIGRNVANCHPPSSVHVVEQILSDFKNNKKDEESFWIKMGGKYVYIRYFAVRDTNGEYLGTLEVTQNIKPIQEITGEKRLLSD